MMNNKHKLQLGKKKSEKKIQKHEVYFVRFNYMDDFTG